MVKLGNLSTDGTKMGANASRHKAMSYGYMSKEIARLQAEIKKLLEQAEQVDVEEDATLGSRRGDELPDELKRRTERLAKIEEAQARLESEAAARRRQSNASATPRKPSAKPKAASGAVKNRPPSMPRLLTRRKRTSPIPKPRS
jgi:chromosome segregation ATPase